MSRWLALGTTFVLALGVTACGNGYSTEDAQERCDEEREARNANGTPCFDEDGYQACVTAHEECGDDVLIDESSCPIVFNCNE